MDEGQERELILLAAICLSKKDKSKKAILDIVQRQSLMNFTAYQLEIHDSNGEIIWRNQLAWARSRLVEAGCISNDRRNFWDITPKGKVRAKDLLETAFLQKEFTYLNPKKLSSIRNWLNSSASESLSDEAALDRETALLEGGRKLYWANKAERNPRLRALAIEIQGVICRGCGFDFEKKYGPIGKDFIEVHHVNPISDQENLKLVDARNDFIVLCSNCHSITHRKKPRPLTLEELRKICC